MNVRVNKNDQITDYLLFTTEANDIFLMYKFTFFSETPNDSVGAMRKSVETLNLLLEFWEQKPFFLFVGISTGNLHVFPVRRQQRVGGVPLSGHGEHGRGQNVIVLALGVGINYINGTLIHTFRKHQVRKHSAPVCFLFFLLWCEKCHNSMNEEEKQLQLINTVILYALTQIDKRFYCKNELLLLI